MEDSDALSRHQARVRSVRSAFVWTMNSEHSAVVGHIAALIEKGGLSACSFCGGEPATFNTSGSLCVVCVNPGCPGTKGGVCHGVIIDTRPPDKTFQLIAQLIETWERNNADPRMGVRLILGGNPP